MVMFSPYLERWSLASDGQPIITHSSRLLPVIWQEKPAMLKIATDSKEREGALLMKWWDGDGAARVYAQEDDAVLLERATDKYSLLHMAMNGKDDEATRIMVRTAARLHAPRPTPLHNSATLEHWFRSLEPAAGAHGSTFADCLKIANGLLAAPQQLSILHGDIHHRNILDFGERGWLAIDPKRIYGERGYDFANIFANEELPTTRAPARLQRQLPIVAREADIEPSRLLKWIVAYSGLSAAWFLEDGQDASAEHPLTVARIALAELA